MLQEDINTTSEPFKESARVLGISTGELFAKAKEYEQIGVMRRFAAILRHRDAGFSANGMVVWRVPDNKIDEVGCKLAHFPRLAIVTEDQYFLIGRLTSLVWCMREHLRPQKAMTRNYVRRSENSRL